MSLHEFMVKETFKKPARCMKIKSHTPLDFLYDFYGGQGGPGTLWRSLVATQMAAQGARHNDGGAGWALKAPGTRSHIYIYI